MRPSPRRGYGANIHARAAANGGAAAAEQSGDGSGGGNGAPRGLQHAAEAERQNPYGSVDIDSASICDNEECPFPTHHAFDAATAPKTRLRNQVGPHMVWRSTLRLLTRADSCACGLHALEPHPLCKCA